MRFENQTISQDITVDFSEFDNVEFKNCKVIFRGGAFSFKNVRFTNVEYVMADAANNTLIYLRFIKAMDKELFENFIKGPTPQDPGKPAEQPAAAKLN